MRWFLCSGVVALAILGAIFLTLPEAASAATTYQLDCQFDKNEPVTSQDCPNQDSIGTVTFTDLGASVRLDIVLFEGQFRNAYINLNPALGTTGYSLSVGTIDCLTFADPQCKANGDNGEGFDMQIDFGSTAASWSTVISKTSTSLGESDFAFTSASGFFAAVHVQSLGAETCDRLGRDPGCSEWKGATPGDGPPPGERGVPEPGIALLLGTGMLGTLLTRRFTITLPGRAC